MSATGFARHTPALRWERIKRAVNTKAQQIEDSVKMSAVSKIMTVYVSPILLSVLSYFAWSSLEAQKANAVQASEQARLVVDVAGLMTKGRDMDSLTARLHQMVILQDSRINSADERVRNLEEYRRDAFARGVAVQKDVQTILGILSDQKTAIQAINTRLDTFPVRR